jgi:hypothetical protein
MNSVVLANQNGFRLRISVDKPPPVERAETKKNFRGNCFPTRHIIEDEDEKRMRVLRESAPFSSDLLGEPVVSRLQALRKKILKASSVLYPAAFIANSASILATAVLSKACEGCLRNISLVSAVATLFRVPALFDDRPEFAFGIARHKDERAWMKAPLASVFVR